MPYSDKYTPQNTSFSDRHSARGTSFADKLSRRIGFLLQEDTLFLLLESGGKIAISGAPYDNKYSPRNN